MKRDFLFCVLLCLSFFSCSKEKVWESSSGASMNQQAISSLADYRIDSNILIALQKEEIFLNAVSIDNQRRIIEKLNLPEEKVVDKADLLLMNYEDFVYLCEKYDCDIVPYLILELSHTVAERLDLMSKNKGVETKAQIDVIANCQTVKNLVVSQVAEAYKRAREINNIIEVCDCSSVNSCWGVAISNLDYMFMATYPPESGEWRLYRKIYQLSFGFQQDIGSMSMSDVEEIVNLPRLDVLFANLKGDIKWWGNSMLPHHLSLRVICTKSHICPVCGEINCNRDHDQRPDPDTGEVGGDWSGGNNPKNPCEYCGETNCTGECVADIKNRAPQAVRIFKVNRDISLAVWEQIEIVIHDMLGGEAMVDYLARTLKEKISLTLSYNGGCKNVFLTNTISIRMRYYNIDMGDFIKSLFHIYQYQYYGEYDMSYAMNLEFEAETCLYLSCCILAGGTAEVMDICPVFDNAEIESRYKAWIEELVYIFENDYGMGIFDVDYVDFLTSYANAVHAEDSFDEYKDMKANTSKGMLDAMFSFMMETRSRFDF